MKIVSGLQRKMIELFDSDYFVYVTNQNDRKAFLTECDAMGIRWQSGDRALEYAEGKGGFYFEVVYRDTYSIRASLRARGDRSINWADLVEQSRGLTFAFTY